MKNFDLIILGGGPGGYVAAIRASQLGLNVAVIEAEQLGGVCLNWGCIPTKALLKSAEVLRTIKHAKEFGIDAEIKSVNLQQMVDRSRVISANLSKGISGLLKKNRITHIQGYGRFKNSTTITVTSKDQQKEDLAAKNIIIATGAKSREMAHLKADGKRIWLARHAMMPTFTPKTLLVIGSGAIGMEFASFYNTLGVDVTIVEMCPTILPQEDHEISTLAKKSFEKQGMNFNLECSVDALINKGDSVEASIKNKQGKIEKLSFDAAIIAIGIVGNTDDLDLQNTKVVVDRNQIKTDAFSKTNDANIYAIGDVAGAPWLAHKASHEGIIAAEHLAGKKTHGMDKKGIPGCTYTHPQIASIGMTEAKAKDSGFDIKVGRFPFMANGKAMTIDETEGLVKTIFDKKTGELLGAHMIGHEVTELIQGFVIAQKLETTEQDLMHTIFPHPTLSEMMHESVLNAFDQTIHF